MGGIFVIVAGVWVISQVVAGDALTRLGLTSKPLSGSTGGGGSGGGSGPGGGGGGGSW